MKKVKITVKSANHKYQAILDTKTQIVAIAEVAGSYGKGWEKKEPRWFSFPLERILAHNSSRFMIPSDMSLADPTLAQGLPRIPDQKHRHHQLHQIADHCPGWTEV